MKDPLVFLRQLKSTPPPPAVHLAGDDSFIREVVRKRIVAVWCGEGGDAPVEILLGTEGAANLPKAFGSSSFFESRKVIVLTDPPASSRKGAGKTNPLSVMGKNQISALKTAVGDLPVETCRLVIETGVLKPGSQLLKVLGDVTDQVDVSPPRQSARQKWVTLMAQKTGVLLEPDLEEALSASDAPLGVLLADLEKVALATPEGVEAQVHTWQSLTQAEPESTVWEIGDHLGAGKAGNALACLRNLEAAGTNINQIVPALLSWNQQRLQVKSIEAGRKDCTPTGMHPFVVKKMKAQVAHRSLAELRKEQRRLCYLDRALKQSWENPHTLLEKILVEFAAGRTR